jgi:hypothetical protein
MRKLVGNVMSVVPRNWTCTVCPRQAARLNARCVYEVALVVALRVLKLPSVAGNVPVGSGRFTPLESPPQDDMKLFSDVRAIGRADLSRES